MLSAVGKQMIDNEPADVTGGTSNQDCHPKRLRPGHLARSAPRYPPSRFIAAAPTIRLSKRSLDFCCLCSDRSNFREPPD